MISVIILGVLAILILLILPLIVLFTSNLADKIRLELSYPGQHFIVRGCNNHGVMIEQELILDKIEGNLYYFKYPMDHHGDRIACLLPHHIDNYKKSFWKL